MQQSWPAILTNPDEYLADPGPRSEVFSMVRNPLPTSFEQGVHIRVVQEVLGHTRVTTTERYTHVATLQMKDASERMSEALWGQG